MPVFNTNFPFNFLLSIPTDGYFKFILLIDAYHNNTLKDKYSKLILNYNLEKCYLELEGIYKKYSGQTSASQWQIVYIYFFTELKQQLPHSNKKVAYDATLPLNLSKKIKNNHPEFLENSKTILKQMQLIFHMICQNRQEFFKELTTYIDALNTFLEKNETSFSATQSKLEKLCPDFEPVFFEDMPIPGVNGAPPATVFAASAKHHDLAEELRDFRTDSHRGKVEAQILDVDLLIEQYGMADIKLQESLRADIRIKHGVLNFLRTRPNSRIELTEDFTFLVRTENDTMKIDQQQLEWLNNVAEISYVETGLITKLNELKNLLETDPADKPYKIIHGLVPVELIPFFEQLMTEVFKKFRGNLEYLKSKSLRAAELPACLSFSNSMSSYTHITSAIEYAGCNKTLSWLNLLIQFRHIRVSLISCLKDFVMQTRNALKEIIQTRDDSPMAVASGEDRSIYNYMDNEWLLSWFDKLYFTGEPKCFKGQGREAPTPAKRKGIQQEVLSVVKHLENIKKTVIILEQNPIPHFTAKTPGEHEKNYQHLSRVTQGIKSAYVERIADQIRRNLDFKELKRDHKITPIFKELITTLNAKAGIPAAMQKLSSAPFSRVQSEKNEFVKVCKEYSDISGEFASEVMRDTLMLGAMAKRYLPKLAPTV